ncbi:hypothetical protein [Citrobacter portucalensis]|uniref:hypothetical protein n=1 Tax=Citrobacter portucalensis TaxID=1639133 RepID=UPI001FCB3056|nr:hypothetical protein [Citrobacter portucalensis]
MASKSLWAIVDFLRINQTITPRQVQSLLGCDCKKAHNLLLHLVRRAVVIRTGEQHRPVYSLQPGGELNIKQLKSSMSKTWSHQFAAQVRLCSVYWRFTGEHQHETNIRTT